MPFTQLAPAQQDAPPAVQLVPVLTQQAQLPPLVLQVEPDGQSFEQTAPLCKDWPDEQDWIFVQTLLAHTDPAAQQAPLQHVWLDEQQPEPQV